MTGTLAVPALATAQSFSITSPSGGSSFPANGNVPYTTTMNFDSGKTPQRALITTSPGVLAALSANPSCLQTRQITEACHIGDGQASIGGVAPAALAAYLVPANDPVHDVAGIDLVAAVGNPTHAEIQLKQNSAGNVSAVLNVDFSGAPPGITGSTLTVNKTLNGKPFTRMPSNCAPGPSSLTIQYSDGSTKTTNASPDFNITGCSALPYAPKLSGVIIKDPGDSGAQVTTTVTQDPAEAASAGNALTVPFPALAANSAGATLQCPVAPCATAVGDATSVSPLVPTPLVGKVYLTGQTPIQPQLTIIFPPPSQLILTGSVNLQTSTVTFNGVPDVPVTKLVVTLFGGPKALEMATCMPPDGTLSGTFTGQNGKIVHDTLHVVVSGCPLPPSVSGASLTGASRGKPVLRFKLLKGAGAPKLKSFTLSVPARLRLNARGLARGLSVHGVKSVSLRGHKLTVTLRGAATTIQVKLSAPLLLARGRLPEHLKLRITAVDAAGTRTALTATT